MKWFIGEADKVIVKFWIYYDSNKLKKKNLN